MEKLIKKLYNLNHISGKAKRELNYHYSNTDHFANEWLNDWIYRTTLTDEITDWSGPEAKDYAEQVKESLYLRNIINHLTSIANAIYCSDELDIPIPPQNEHICEVIQEYATNQLDIHPKMARLISIWVWS